MMNVRRAGLFVVLLALAGCALRPAKVPVIATPLQVSALAGTWDGHYDSEEYGGRSGYIHFELSAGRDTAAGYVVMTFRLPPGMQPRAGRITPAPPVAQSEQLSIKFVLAVGTEIVGELDPYVNPDCGCRLATTFRGELHGNEIKGTFETRHVDTGSVVRGTWVATRQPSQ
jgi:hypothetical protein